MNNDKDKEVKVEVKESLFNQEVGRMASIPASVARRHGVRNGEIIHGRRAQRILKEAFREVVDEYKRT